MSVADNLRAMVGVWHDHVTGYHPDGTVMAYDQHGGSPGPYPYDNLVYVDLVGEVYTQTNVTFRGRPLHVRTFTGKLVDGVLHFDQLGPDDPGHVGVSGGPGILWFVPARIDEALQRFSDPDHIRLLGADQRTRTTTLYRQGELVRVLSVSGTRLSADPTVRHDLDPRGPDGPVHAERSTTHVYVQEDE